MLNFRPGQYNELLGAKHEKVRQRFDDLGVTAIDVFPSPREAYRMRAEFRVWHEGDDLFYAMFDRQQPKTPLRIESFPIASRRIQDAMPALREALIDSPVLRRKLFQVEFLSTLSGELLISLIYHRQLEEDWESSAGGLESHLQAAVIGRSRKQKWVLSRDYVEEELSLAKGTFRYRQYEQGFTQPNAVVNCDMVNWACAQASGAIGDLLELYCGNGNFTLPLSTCFDTVLATEVAKSSIKAALHNCDINGVENLAIARLSAEEVAGALAGEREFRRLQALEKPLTDYRFSTVFVDPPRAGLDAATRVLVSQFDRVLYISCNPETLHRDLEAINNSHRIAAFALFDQFPYTDHIECGALLERR